MNTMKATKLPILTLEEIVAMQAEKQLDNDIHVFELKSNEDAELRLNYPCKGDFLAIMLVVSGTVQVKVDFETAVLGSRDLVFTLPNNITEFQAVSSDCHMIGILMSVESMSKVGFAMDADETMIFLSESYSKFIELDSEVFDAVGHIVNRLDRINRKDRESQYNTEVIWRYATLLFYELSNFTKRNAAKAKNNTYNSSRQEELAIRFVELVARDFRLHRDVIYYAERLHVSRKHLTKIIKFVFGLTPKQIIDGKVIAEAKVLLQKRELNVREIMRELTFEDQPTFSKFFKKNTGLAPLSYRRHIDN